MIETLVETPMPQRHLLEGGAVTILEFTLAFQRLFQRSVFQLETLKKDSQNVAQGIVPLYKDLVEFSEKNLVYQGLIPESEIVSNLTSCKFKLLAFSDTQYPEDVCKRINALEKDGVSLRLHAATHEHLIVFKQALKMLNNSPFSPLRGKTARVASPASAYSVSNKEQRAAVSLLEKFSEGNVHFQYKEICEIPKETHILVFEY